MVAARDVRFQLRLIACHVVGVLAEFITMPHLLAWGLDMGNVVLAWLLGVAFFLILAIAGGVIFRRSIQAHPARSALVAPLVLAPAIYLSLRSISGFDPGEAPVALDVAIVGGVCALFSSACFLLWTALAPGRAATGREDAELQVNPDPDA